MVMEDSIQQGNSAPVITSRTGIKNLEHLDSLFMKVATKRMKC